MIFFGINANKKKTVPPSLYFPPSHAGCSQRRSCFCPLGGSAVFLLSWLLSAALCTAFSSALCPFELQALHMINLGRYQANSALLEQKGCHQNLELRKESGYLKKSLLILLKNYRNFFSILWTKML